MVGNDVVDLADPQCLPMGTHRRFDQRVFTPSELRMLHASATPARLRWVLWAAKESAYKILRKRDAAVTFAPRRFVVEPQEPATGRTVAFLPAGAPRYAAKGGRLLGANGCRVIAQAFFRSLRVGPIFFGAVSRGGSLLSTLPAGAGVRDCTPHISAPVHGTVTYAGHRVAFRGVIDGAALHVIAADEAEGSFALLAAVAESATVAPGIAVRRVAAAAVADRLGVPADAVRITRQDRIPRLQVRGVPLPIDLSLSHHGRFVGFAALMPCHGGGM